MKKNFFGLITALATVMLMTSCGAFYFPQMGNMPLVSQKGELVAEAAVAPMVIDPLLLIDGGYGTRGLPYQLACSYAATDHMVAQISLRRMDGAEVRHQAMAGWYTPLGDHATVEVMGGFAAGRSMAVNESLKSVEGYTDYRIKGRYQCLFVQGDIGFPSFSPVWLKKIAFSAGFGLRAGGVWMKYDQSNYGRPDEDGVCPLTSVDLGMTASLFELQPMLQLGLGGHRFKMEIGAGHSFFLGSQWPEWFPLSVNLSFTYRIPLKKLLD